MGPAAAELGAGGSNQRLARGSRHSPVASPEASGAPLVATAIGEWRTARHPLRPPPVGGTMPTATTSAWPLISPAAGPPQWRRGPLPAPLRGPAAAHSDWSSRPSLNLDRWLGGGAARTCERLHANRRAARAGPPPHAPRRRDLQPHRAPPPPQCGGGRAGACVSDRGGAPRPAASRGPQRVCGGRAPRTRGGVTVPGLWRAGRSLGETPPTEAAGNFERCANAGTPFAHTIERTSRGEVPTARKGGMRT